MIFSYNPDAENPLTVFELGDAFTAGWTSRRVGKLQISPYEYFRIGSHNTNDEAVFQPTNGKAYFK